MAGDQSDPFDAAYGSGPSSTPPADDASRSDRTSPAPPSYGPPGYPPPSYAPPVHPPPVHPAPGYPPPGYPPAAYAPPGYAPPGQIPPPGYAGAPGYAPSAYSYGLPQPTRKRRLSRRSIIALCVLGGLVLLLVIGGVAASIDQRPANRAVAIPTSVLGLPQEHNPTLDNATTQAIATLDGNSAFKDAQAAYFGTATLPDLYVFAAKVTRRPTASARRAYFQGMANALFVNGPMETELAGPYGGELQCAEVSNNGIDATMCASIDDAAAVGVIVFKPQLTDAADTTRQVIAAVEH